MVVNRCFSCLLLCAASLCSAIESTNVGNTSIESVFIQAEVPSDGQLVFSSMLDSAWRIRGLDSVLCSLGCTISIQLMLVDGESRDVLQSAFQTFEAEDFPSSNADDEGLSIQIPYSGLDPYLEYALILSILVQNHSSRPTSTVQFRTGVYPKLSIPSPDDEPNMDEGACRLEIYTSER
jgi:hypothetical protein